MIADIVMGVLVFVVAVSHIHWRLKFGERLLKLEDDWGSEKHEDCQELMFPKHERAEEFYYKYLGLFGARRERQERYYFFVPLARVVQDLMNHTGMEYKYEEEKPEKIEAIKKPVARKRK